MPSVEVLNLHSCGLDGMEGLHAFFPNLRTLELGGNKITQLAGEELVARYRALG